MNAFALLVILAAAAGSPSAPTEEALAAAIQAAGSSGVAAPARHPDAIPIFHSTFDRRSDVNYDGWPDNWRRVFGVGRPKYVEAGIQRDETAVAGACLAVMLNGGGARVESPLVAVSDSYSYVVQSRIRIQDMKFARARLVVEFCNEDRQVQQTAPSEWFVATEGWQELMIGPVSPSSGEVSLSRIVLEVQRGARVDLTGSAAIDDVWMGRLPKMQVSTNNPFNVYTDSRDVLVKCELSGIRERDPDIVFELLDASDHRLDDNRVRLEGRLITERSSKASDIVDNAVELPAGYAGSTSWHPPIKEDGFYRVRVIMRTANGLQDEKTVSIAIVPPLTRPNSGEFGWSLAGDDVPLSFDNLADLLPRAAVHWVKLPVWYGKSESARGDRLVVFAEQLAAEDIELVGVVDRPPANSELAARLADDATIADTLSLETSTWLPLMDPVLSRLSLRVRWWQLGDDRDTSFSTFPHLEREIAKLRGKLFRFGQDVNVGLGWQWTRAAAGAVPATWDFQQFSDSPPLTGAELAEYLKLPRRKGVARWVLIEPLSRDLYDLETRARDLVEQMLAARMQGADAIFAAHPFDDECGLMTDSGSPGELLLPWRTTALLLSGTKFLGAVQLPGRSQNQLFETPDGEVLMVVWNHSPTDETIYLGENVKVIDVWGREHLPPMRAHRQVIHTEPLPRFVTGVNPHIARWRMAVQFGSPHVPSVFGKAHPNQLLIRNEFPQGVGGYARIRAPEGWQIAPDRIEFKLGEGHDAAKPFEVSLPFDANSGDTPVQIDFRVDAERPYQFTVYRRLDVGDGLVECEIHTRLQEDGTLVVEQRMINRGPELVDFKCMLYAAGRRRQRTQVFRLGSRADVKIYEYPNGADLLGAEFWLRAEEVNGLRVINRRFLAQQ